MIEAAIAALQQELQAELAKLAENYATVAQLNEVKETLNDMRLEFVDHVDAYLEFRDYVEYAIANLQAVDSDILSRLEALEGMENADISDVLKRLEALEALSKKEYYVKGELDEVIAQAYAADALSKMNGLRIDTLYTLLENYNVVDTAAIWTEIRGLKAELVEVRAEAVENLAQAKAYADSVANDVKEELAGLTVKVGDLEKALVAAEEKLQAEIDELAEEVAGLAEEVASLTEEVANLTERVDEIEDHIEKQITNVVINGAYSPVVGYFNLPNGTKSNILAAYYGKVTEDFNFPTVDWSDNGVTIDEAAFEAMGFASKAIEIKNNKYGVLVSDSANAGKVYMTINPAEVSLKGKTFSLVNSLNQESPAEIINVKPSTEKLAFGYTRAGAVALYEAEVRIENVADARLRLELSDLKDALVDVVKFKDGVNVTDLVTTLYEVVNDIADANAVKASWTDASGEEHTVYSDYSLAAVAIKPLGYTFLKDAQFDIESYVDVSRFINALFNKVGSFEFPELGVSAKIGDVIGNIESLANGVITLPISVPVTIPFGDMKDGQFTIKAGSFDVKVDGEVVGTAPSQDVVIPVKPSEIVGESYATTVSFDYVVNIKDILADLGISNNVDQLTALLNKVNSVISALGGTKVEDIATLDKVLNKLENGFYKAIDKVNGVISSAMGSFNASLQPTMLVGTNSGFTMLSSVKAMPTVINSASAVFVPTSFTAEILAPACQKFVAVTKAFDANGNEDLAAAKAVNAGNLATVLAGGTRAVEFNGKSGYTYEIVYQAMDFHGFIANTKYYVRVK